MRPGDAGQLGGLTMSPETRSASWPSNRRQRRSSTPRTPFGDVIAALVQRDRRKRMSVEHAARWAFGEDGAERVLVACRFVAFSPGELLDREPHRSDDVGRRV